MRVIPILVATALLMAACGGSGNTGGAADQDRGASTSATVNAVNNTTIGAKILVGQNGHALYTYDGDDGSTPKCYASCAENWPPDIVTGQPTTSAGGTVGATPRSDGSTQVTYNGKPLYFSSVDFNPGTAYGDDMQGVWHVVKVP